jgi:hypothetical protein
MEVPPLVNLPIRPSLPDAKSGQHVRRMPFDTTEVRWFGTGRMPADVLNWFTKSGSHGSLEIRQDAYLSTGSVSIGRKRRNHGPLEIKTRRGLGATFILGDVLMGSIEEWRKIVSPGWHHPRRSRRWADVHKVVVTRTYQQEPTGGLVEVLRGDMSLPGCDVELAEVAVNDTEAWTLAFEAWGPGDQQRSILYSSADRFLAGAELPADISNRLTVSMGYPAFLAQNRWGNMNSTRPPP